MFEDNSAVPIVKVIDFGLCATLKDGHTSRAFVGTRLYAAPEMMRRDKHSLPCDLWSIGVMTYKMVSGDFPFYSENAEHISRLVLYGKQSYPKE
ncbi:unnamed protein product, partial [Discosporangium mesarthrocarpum]